MPISFESPFLRRSGIPNKKAHMIAFFESGKSKMSCLMDILQPDICGYLRNKIVDTLNRAQRQSLGN